jgi:Ras-related protein Rab-32
MMKKAKNALKVGVVGDHSVGKTNLIRRLTTDSFDPKYKPTIGADFTNKSVITDDRELIFQFWG